MVQIRRRRIRVALAALVVAVLLGDPLSQPVRADPQKTKRHTGLDQAASVHGPGCARSLSFDADPFAATRDNGIASWNGSWVDQDCWDCPPAGAPASGYPASPLSTAMLAAGAEGAGGRSGIAALWYQYQDYLLGATLGAALPLGIAELRTGVDTPGGGSASGNWGWPAPAHPSHNRFLLDARGYLNAEDNNLAPDTSTIGWLQANDDPNQDVQGHRMDQHLTTPSSCVPEPRCFALLAIAGLLLLTRQCRPAEGVKG